MENVKIKIKFQRLLKISFIISILSIFFFFSYAKASENLNEIDLNHLAKSKPVHDPLEKVNRKIYKFNKILYKGYIIPLTKSYRKFVPEFFRDRVDNFSSNLSTPIYFTNNILQLNVKGALVNLWRFVFNSTIGVLGLFDIASSKKLHGYQYNFSSTLAKYGIKSGVYLVLPILGSSSARGSLGLAGDFYLDPLSKKINNKKILNNSQQITREALYYLNKFSSYYDLFQDIENNSLDPYISFRSLYIQIEEAKNE